MKPTLALLLVISSVSAENKISEANNRFAPDVYKHLAKTEPGNLLFSPLSAVTVLALLRSGTKGESAQELGEALHFPETKQEVQDETKNLMTQLQSSKVATFEIANGIFIQDGFDVQESFLETATDDFFATSRNVDFGKNQEAADEINQYVEDHTNKTIQNLVNPDYLSNTVMILVNALHFKGDWLFQFPEAKTQPEEFLLTPCDSVTVDFLHVTKTFNYYESESLGAEFLELPFEEEDASMVIALPQDHDSLTHIEGRIDEVLSVDSFEKTALNVALPRFKFDYKIDFGKVLRCLGVKKIFGAGADLSGIAGEKGDLVVDQVVQKAFIDVNEGGVEASAATLVGIGRSATVEAPRDFKAKRPFIFFIKFKGVVAFLGKLVQPKY